jgi:hypothetical protein
MARPRLKKLAQLRRQAARSGNQKRFSNLTNRIRDKRGLPPLSDARKNKMFKRLGGPDNTTFNRPGMPGAGGKRRPLPGGGRIMKGPKQGGLQEMQAPVRMQPGRLRKPGQPDNTTFNRQVGSGGGLQKIGAGGIQGPILGVTSSQGGPIPDQRRPINQGRPIQNQGGPTPKPIQGRPRQQGPNNMPGMGRPVLFKDGGEVESMPMGERPYKEEKGKKNSMRGVGKAIQGTKFKGVF